MKHKFKIAVLTSDNPLDRKSWSGSHYHLIKALENKFETVVTLGPYQPEFSLLAGKIFSKLSQIFLNKRFDYAHSKSISKSYAAYFDKKINSVKPDLIIAPSACCEIAYLQTKVPIIYVCDATVQSSLNYHKALSNLFSFSLKESQETEQNAIDKSSLVVTTSPWAMKSVTEFYKKEKNKTAIIPFGANFEEEPDATIAKNRSLGKTCRLLFVGVQWENKGGPIAVNVLNKLLSNGIEAELTICGCTPPVNLKNEKIKVIPFLNKNIEQERKQLYKFFEEATFLILPTRFEAYGLVFCEASAYGLPSLATNTGGVSGIIEEGVNGFLFDFKNEGNAYAEKIIELFNDADKYKKLALTSRKVYEEKLNWNKWADSLVNKLQELHLLNTK